VTPLRKETQRTLHRVPEKRVMTTFNALCYILLFMMAMCTFDITLQVICMSEIALLMSC